MIRILHNFKYVVLLGTLIMFLTSCSEEDDPTNTEFGTITGMVTDGADQPISGVEVTVSGVNEEDVTTTTGSDGKYTVENISIKTHAVSFAKTGWQTVSVTVTPAKFDADRMATADVSMLNASAKITGKVSDANNGGAGLPGVAVSIGSESDTTGADGTFMIENLVEGDYTVTFTKEDFVPVTKQVSTASFLDGVATINIQMGANELLRGLTAEDLQNAQKWYFNEYRGGRNADAYPHWDWACDYMCTLDFQGAWEEQNEGTTLQIRNNEEDRGNPANLDVFDSYVYGSKLITEDNKIMSVRLRTHNADESSPAYYGVQVIDLSAAEPAAVKVGDNRTYGSENYSDIEFDLSEYVGKEVIIAIGIYRQATGDYWKQLVLRAIRFADQKVEGTDWLPGNEVIEGWALTQETVRSTMPHTQHSFTGISPISGNRDNYVDAYRAWNDVNHIAATWSFVPLHKDPEVFPSEGYLIKTRGGGTNINTVVPEAYMYAKFSIGAGSDQLTFMTRNFSTDYTYFKITAIENDGTITHLQPQSNTANDASAAEDGCWKFVHEQGDANHPDEYASFMYDLSEFDGKDVTLVIGVYKGADSGTENKLVLRSIELD